MATHDRENVEAAKMETCSYLSLLRLQAAAWLEVSAALSGLQWHFGPILREVRPLFGVRVDSGPVLRLVFFSLVLESLTGPTRKQHSIFFYLLLLLLPNTKLFFAWPLPTERGGRSWKEA